jgi:hypothetical protein
MCAASAQLPAHEMKTEPSLAPPESPPAPAAPASPPATDVQGTVLAASPANRGPGSARPAPERAAAPQTGAPITSWRDLIAAGRSADVVAEATARGLGSTLARARREDLSALADAARYSRHNDVARGALRALRDRFRSSDSAHDAAFFLGLVDEAEDPGSLHALEWYRRYRAEAPGGLYVADALAREILLEERIHGAVAARAAAREYLTRFPHGAMARDAARLANQSP